VKRIFTAAVGIAALISSGAATAAESTPAAAEMKGKEAPPRGKNRGARVHDGFFARSDTSLAFYRAVISGPGASRRSGALGLGQGAGLALGGTPAPGLVVGGFAWATSIDPVFIEGGKTVSPDDDSVKITLLRIGPFVDWYPDPRGGFHALAEAAFTAEVESDVKGNPIEPAATGAALSVGAGYEWFIFDEFSMGFFGRLSLGRLGRTPPGGHQEILWLIPEIAISATFH
jgi:hypothetical protein